MDVKDLLRKDRYDLNDLRHVFTCLRSENGCPWDRVQTHESIRANLIEETYEVVEAIDNADLKLMREELGDLLLQIVFHAGIEEENDTFTLDDVISDITEKLIRRHPHVFGDIKADDPEGALDAWEAAKGVEKAERKTAADSMRAVPPSLPALMRAQKISKKAEKDGYDTDKIITNGVSSVVELSEFMSNPTELQDNFSSLLGDALFAISVLSEKNGTDAEFELGVRCEKFIENYPE